MHKIFTAIFAITVLISLSACGNTPELKSPCVGAENSPCDRRVPNQA